jgi:hypothetical protein
MAATDLVAWTKLLGLKEQPDLAKSEIDTFRYRVLHVAARITRGARQIRMRIDATWRWATAISEGWQRLRAAFSSHPVHRQLDPRTHRPWNRPPAERHRPTRRAQMQQSAPQTDQHRPRPNRTGRAKNRG